MSLQKNKWYKLANQNLAVFMRQAGFDLAIFDQYSKSVRDEARRKSIAVAIRNLQDRFYEQTEAELSTIKRGVYVIRLSGNTAIKYQKGYSSVIYIGQGSIQSRIKGHYEWKLFDFMRSLNGMNFDFYVSEPWKKYYRGTDFHKQIECTMISDFAENFAGLNDRYCFPLMNKVAGSDRGIDIQENWWRLPLKSSGKKTEWILEPGKHSEFVGSMD